jgi:hypothetical protein
MNESILIGGSNAGQVFLNPRYANRHGLLAGACSDRCSNSTKRTRI